MQTLPDFGLIETFGRTPEGDFPRLTRHLKRLKRSAAYFGFNFQEESIHFELGKTATLTGALRVRLQLKRDASVEITAAPFQPSPPGTVWRLAIANERLDPSSSLIPHKTTERSSYDNARVEFDRETVDEVLLLNTRGEICEGTITNLFIKLPDSDVLLTPAASCGLLPGILREELIENGGAREAVLLPSEIKLAQNIFVGNSLRGLIQATLG
jgi:4-amino-4-deoxychorismate lyase